MVCVYRVSCGIYIRSDSRSCCLVFAPLPTLSLHMHISSLCMYRVSCSIYTYTDSHSCFLVFAPSFSRPATPSLHMYLDHLCIYRVSSRHLHTQRLSSVLSRFRSLAPLLPMKQELYVYIEFPATSTNTDFQSWKSSCPSLWLLYACVIYIYICVTHTCVPHICVAHICMVHDSFICVT